MLLAVGLTWAVSLHGQTTVGARRVADDGAPVPARVLLEHAPCGLIDFSEAARLLTDAQYAEFLSSAKDGQDGRYIVTVLRNYMKEYPDAPHRNRLRAMLADLLCLRRLFCHG